MWKIFLICLLSSLIFACSSQSKFVATSSLIVLPKEPPVVIVENEKIDKKKYLNATWVKAPTVDNNKKTASWSFDDVEKINESLVLWSGWGKDVKELIAGHNNLVGGGGQVERSSWLP